MEESCSSVAVAVSRQVFVEVRAYYVTSIKILVVFSCLSVMRIDREREGERER